MELFNFENGNVEAVLRRNGIDFAIHGNEAVAVCPKCAGSNRRNERKWQINLQTGAFICNRLNNCGWTGGFRDLQAYFGETPSGTPKIQALKVPARVYKAPDTSKVNGLSPEHVTWLNGRAIDLSTIKAFGITGKPGSIAFPVFDLDGKLVNLKWRLLESKRFWNETGTLRLPFGLHLVPQDAKTLMITEGELDAMAAHQLGVTAVISLPNGTKDLDWIDPLWNWLDRFDVFHLSLDMDAAGQEGRKRLVTRLGAWRCRSIDLPAPHKDLNDCLKAGITEIQGVIEGAGDFRPEKLRSIADLADDIFLIFENKAGLMGKATGFPGLDATIKGWRGGELSVWTGQNGSGKSTVIGQIVLNQIAIEERCCVASLELAALRYIRWLICQHLNMPDPWERAISKAMGDLAQGLWLVDHLGSISLDELLPTFEYAARRFGVRTFVVDSLVKIRLSGDALEAQKRAVERLCDFADKFDCHVHLICHPRKGESDNDRPDKMAVKGSGDITDLADNVFSVHRNKKMKPGEPSTILAVLKNREHGLEGNVPLYVNPETKRVSEFGVVSSVITDFNPRPTDPVPDKRFRMASAAAIVSEPVTQFTGTVVQEIDFPDDDEETP